MTCGPESKIIHCRFGNFVDAEGVNTPLTLLKFVPQNSLADFAPTAAAAARDFSGSTWAKLQNSETAKDLRNSIPTPHRAIGARHSLVLRLESDSPV